MSLREEIDAIIKDKQMSYDEKKKELAGLITEHEINALLPRPVEIPRLKEPLRPRRENMRILRLPIAKEFWGSVLQGGFDDQRVLSDFYKGRITYVEDGVRYLKPFDAVTFFRGQLYATLALKDIKCDGEGFEVYCGDVIETNAK